MNRLKIILLSLFTPLLLTCQSEQETSTFKTQSDKKQYIKPDISGQWKLVQSKIVEDIDFLDIHPTKDDYPFVMSEGGPFEYVEYTDLIITPDTIFRIKYPMELLIANSYSIDSGYLSLNGSYEFSQSPVELTNDTLNIYLREHGSYLKESFIKTQFKDSIVTILKKDSVNFPELEGKWMLKRDYWYDYGTHYWLEFDHVIPDSISLTREQILKSLNNGRTIHMKTDGKYREYIIRYREPYLHLVPNGWYKSEYDPYIHYERVETYEPY